MIIDESVQACWWEHAHVLIMRVVLLQDNERAAAETQTACRRFQLSHVRLNTKPTFFLYYK